jgi:hypothetical protein
MHLCWISLVGMCIIVSSCILVWFSCFHFVSYCLYCVPFRPWAPWPTTMQVLDHTKISGHFCSNVVAHCIYCSLIIFLLYLLVTYMLTESNFYNTTHCLCSYFAFIHPGWSQVATKRAQVG